MYLKDLKVNGFKSFADSTRLGFEPGVTAVVGPNGCGKSNIADAIRWVLGEQSAKALRGGSMQDVIFEGTDTRKPMQLCEVSLVFSDCGELLGDAYHEVEIARRVSRDGQSDYSLNGKNCRLKDIQGIFMDTGIGRTSYSIMAQGQIDQILSSNPGERRAIFEEAAGITKYKSQRKEALNKLRQVAANLERLTDVIDEVKRQIASLRRQASKALRYKRLRFRLEKLDLAHSGFHFSALETSLAEAEARAATLGEVVSQGRSGLAAREVEIEEMKVGRSRLNERLQQAQQAVFDLRSEREQAESAARLAEARKSDLSARIEEARQEIASMEDELGGISVRIEEDRQGKREKIAFVDEAEQSFQQKSEELRAVQARLAEEERGLSGEKEEMSLLESELSRLRSECSSLEVHVKSDQMREAGLSEELAGLCEEERAATEALARLRGELEEALVAHARAEDEVGDCRDEVARRREESRRMNEEIQQADRNFTRNTARMRLLEQLQQKLEGFSEGAKALLQGEVESDLPGTSFYPLTRDIHVKPGHARALEALLGSATDAVAGGDSRDAEAAIALLERKKLGRACLHFSSHSPVPKRGAQVELPHFLLPGCDLVRCGEGGDDHPLQALLDGCYFSETASQFFSFWRENPAFDFSWVATAGGELIDRRGLVFGGFSAANENGILQREAEIQDLAAEIAAEKEKIAGLKEAAEGERRLLEAAEAAVEAARSRVMEAADRRSSLQAEERGARRREDEIADRRKRMESEKGNLQERRGSAFEELEALRAKVEEGQRQFTEKKEAVASCEARLGDAREEVEEQRVTLSEARFDLVEKKQQRELIERGLRELEEKRGQLEQTLAQRRREVETTSEQILTLTTEWESQTQRAEQMKEAWNSGKARVEEVRGEYSVLEEEVNAAERGLHDVRAGLEGSQTEWNALQVKLAEQRSRRDSLVEEMEREYGVSLTEVDWRESLWRAEEDGGGAHPLDLDEEEGGAAVGKAEPRPPMTEEDRKALEATDWKQVKEEIRTARNRLQSMGAVNLVAIEEYGELKERFEFLSGQSDDLNQSRDQLVAAIDDINQRSQTQFEVVFNQIKENFSYTFERLFGGGRAALELIEADDPLESGVEIIAQPPGTKLKSIVLLSGGQKTMTAVALLFAIYMVKPSPFCVLDELDAPLDEANIGRFASILQEFTRHSQFIIITHNKRTISEARAIFGVTMEEKGVSKVISMKLNPSSRPLTEEGIVAKA